MPERFEMYPARIIGYQLAEPGSELGADTLPEHAHALILGNPDSSAIAIVGTASELHDLAQCLVGITACLTGARGISFTRAQAEAWAGRELSDDEVAELQDLLPNSTLPDVVSTVAGQLESSDTDT